MKNKSQCIILGILIMTYKFSRFCRKNDLVLSEDSDQDTGNIIEPSCIEPNIEDSTVADGSIKLALQKFSTYLTSPDGGKKDARQVKQIVGHVKLIIEGLNSKSLRNLFNWQQVII